MITNDEVSKYIEEGLSFQRVKKKLSQEDIFFFKEVLERLMKIKPFLPPLGVVFDISYLLTHNKIEGAKDILNLEASKVASSYEEYFLGSLFNDPRLGRCRDLIQKLDSKTQQIAIATLIDQIFMRVKSQMFDSPSNALLSKSLFSLDTKTLLEQSLDCLTFSEFSTLKENYRKLVSSSQRVGSLLADSDIYVLENIDILESRRDRLALSQVADASEIMKKYFPPRTKKMRKRGEVSSKLNDDSAYPMGGYAGMSPKGSIESLVSTELIYMEAEEDIDLFDMRFISNELLKYTRDESSYHREKREIYLNFSSDLTRAKKKDPTLPYQRITLLLAGVLTGINKLVDWMGSSELKIILVIPPDLIKELKLMKLLLREHIQNEVVSFEEELSFESIVENPNNSIIDILYFSSLAFESTFDQEDKTNQKNLDIMEYYITICKEPSLQTGKKEILSGTRIEYWSKFFSSVFQILV